MPLLQSYRVILRHTDPTPAAHVSPEFIAVVSTDSLEAARKEAERLVQTLKDAVTIVSITPIGLPLPETSGRKRKWSAEETQTTTGVPGL